MKIRNIAKFKLMHIKDGHPITIEAGQEKEIPDDIAKLWMKTGKIVKVDDGAKDAEIARLKAENEKLKKTTTEKKKAASQAKKTAFCKTQK